MQANVLTVTMLNEYVRRFLAQDPMLKGVRIAGEISNFKQHVSGHWYFTLKDEQARIACVMFRQHAMAVPFVPLDGMRVVLTGSVGLYTQSGSYQFYAEGMTKDGVGVLYEQYMKLKEKLTQEGLFDAALKRPLPLLPRGIGVVTAKTGAVIHDIVKVVHQRCPGVPIILRPALVQGDGAADDLAAGLEALAQDERVDVVIIGRGGGSMEDLWAFNEEKVVRAIRACPLPVITAIGHEVDVTLADFAGDVRAATPSQAAELAVPNRVDMLSHLRSFEQALKLRVKQGLAEKKKQVMAYQIQMQAMHPNRLIERHLHRLLEKKQRLQSRCEQVLVNKQRQLLDLRAVLMQLGPKEALSKGFALAVHAGKLIKRKHDAPERFVVRFVDGDVPVRKE